ncbi:protein kinase C iota type-like [Sycon ciliatum]|uniref:protein kinase C iota type-like n=1 Tax=Sycon ciliatum TaxID=27933 RepID=UPI0020ADB62D|eukprot:scpid56290/ scgid19482/ Protein kinase C iota type; Atypical protein kinase C-lambda/iota; nPKC-iota
MALEGYVTVQVIFNGKEHMMAVNPITSFDEFTRDVRTMCRLDKDKDMTVKWVDEEGDPCTVESQSELEELIRLYFSHNVIEINMFVFDTVPTAPGMACDGEHRVAYGRRGARRWKKLHRVNGHAFAAKRTYTQFCALCNDRIWGLGRQGYKCMNCKLVVHKKCYKFVHNICEGHAPYLHGHQSDSDEENSRKEAAAKPSSASKRSNDGPAPSPMENSSVISLADFDIVRVIGRGSYAKVLLVELKSTNRLYAMKTIKKELITDDEDIDWVQTEKHVFEQSSNHPFLVGLHSCFQTASRLFFVIEYVNGGDLMFHMQRQRRLPEDHARFYAAEISLALNYLHEKGIIYRDLKLDNVLLDSEGHVKLTDYGMCKEGLRPGDTTSTFCGTPNYIAPEILRGEEYDWSVDWWALGVLMFEMLAGRSPFDVVSGNDHGEQSTEDYLFQVILEKTIRIPRNISVRAGNVLKSFLEKNPKERLGCNPTTGYSDITSHIFFRNVDWELMENRQFPPPYKPPLTDERDLANFDPQFTTEPLEFTPDDPKTLASIDQSEFEGFEYVNPLLMSKADDV